MYPVRADTSGVEACPNFSANHERALLHMEVPPGGVVSAFGALGSDALCNVPALDRVSTATFDAVFSHTVFEHLSSFEAAGGGD